MVLTSGVIKTGPGQQLKLQQQPPLALVNHNGSFLVFFVQRLFEMNTNENQKKYWYIVHTIVATTFKIEITKVPLFFLIS